MAIGKDSNAVKSHSSAGAFGARGGAESIGRSALGNSSSQVQTFVSRIGRGCHVKGSLELVGAAHIDGGVEGQIVCSGELVVGETGIINGRITTESIKVFGQIVGDVVCSENLEFHSGARVKGDIRSPQVVITDGVLYEGRCSMPIVDLPTSSESLEQGCHASTGCSDSSSDD